MDPKSKLVEWRQDGEHLPDFMQDFHDQKELFKTIGPMEGPSGRQVDWITAQCYTIDRFLWFMARHGYTLQKSRARLPFDDIATTLNEARNERQQQYGAVLKEALARNQPDQ